MVVPSSPKIGYYMYKKIKETTQSRKKATRGNHDDFVSGMIPILKPKGNSSSISDENTVQRGNNTKRQKEVLCLPTFRKEKTASLNCLDSMFSKPKKIFGRGVSSRSSKNTFGSTENYPDRSASSSPAHPLRAVTPTEEYTKTRSSTSISSSPASSPGRASYPSPEMLQLQFEETTPRSTSPASAFFQTPQQVLKAEHRVQGQQQHQQPFHQLYDPQEYKVSVVAEENNNQMIEVSPCYMAMPSFIHDNCNNNVSIESDISSFSQKSDSFSCCDWSQEHAALTEDILSQFRQQQVVSPPPNYEGDKLAKSVIQHKAHWELTKEKRLGEMEQGYQQENGFDNQQLDRRGNPSNNKASLRSREDLDDLLLETEADKILATKWKRKKQERMEQVRLERLKESELDRQRRLRLSELEQNQRERRHECRPVEV